MVELTTRQEAKVLTFANKAFTKISALADEARLEENKRKRREIVRSGKKLAKYLIAIDDSRNQWQANSLMLTIDNLINEYDLFEVPVNPSQLSINDLTTRILGETGGDGSGNVTATQLNAEAAARISADNTLQTNIDTVDQRVTDLNFDGLVPETVVFSEATPGFKDFPTELGIALPNKSVLDSVTAQNLTDIGLNNTHRNNGDIHVTLTQKNYWDGLVTPGQLADGLSTKASTSHQHTIGQIQNLQAELDALAQSIIDNSAEDGVTPSISIGSVTSGTTASVTLGAGSTAANPILDFVLVPGDKGEQGDPFEFGAIDFLANRSNYINEAFGFSFVDVQTGLVYYKQAGSGTDSWSGGIRTIGDRGWTPLYLPEILNNNGNPLIVHKLVDYIGGQGVKPTANIGAYVGTNGFVTSPLAAVNYKGNKGDSPVQGVDYEIPRFKIDATLTYQEYLDDASSLLSSQPIGYTIYIEDNTQLYGNKDGRIIILSRNATTGAREWREYEFQGEQGPAGVPGPKGDPGEVEEAPNDGDQYVRQNEAWALVDIPEGSAGIQQVFTYTTGAQDFTLTEPPDLISYVSRNGKVYTDPSLDFSISINTLTINETLISGDEISIFYFTNVGNLVNTYTSSDFNTDFATKTTDDLSEGAINKYLTGNEFQKNVDSTDNITEGNAKFVSQEQLDKISRIQDTATVSTTDAAVTTILTIPIDANSNTTIIGYVLARRTGGTAGSDQDVATYKLEAVYHNLSGTATLVVGGVNSIAESQAGWDCQLVTSGSDVLLRVTGAVDNNIDWKGINIQIMKNS